MKLESERLIIRDFTLKDASFYFELFNDPDWKKFISDKNLKSVDETEAYLQKMQIENSKLGGLGFFTVILKEGSLAGAGVEGELYWDTIFAYPPL